VMVADFDRSNETYRPLVEQLCQEVERAGGGDEEKEVVRAFMGVSTRNFCNVLDLIQDRWGTLQNYLKDTMGLTDADFALLRERYLE